ncbi:hypothetical protein BJX68DRAFT_260742 [Aspergillus pseudodeflectus]|uniref:F-box domain-containing protein n=1 Tax=Aspergillus pseudodeflectus TaxID=176178 RepID=A0ABR4LEN6_9EURO
MFWRLDLSLTRQRVPVTAFSLAVTPQPLPQPTPKPRTFHAFSQLPTELQLHIFRACDAPTLFQLINTASHIRTLALPIFWNIFGRNTWYSITTLSIGYANLFEITYIAHDKSFAKNIAQVEVDIWRGLFEFRGKYGALDADKARRFWAMLRDLFPAAQKVVLAGLVDPDSVQLPFYAAEEEEEGQFGPYSNVVVENPDHAIIRGVLQLAPQGIEAFASFPVKEKAASVQLWGIASDSSPEDGTKMWRLVDLSWNPQRLLLPARKDWSAGPVGEYLTMERLMQLSSLERNGLAWLRHETHVEFPASQRGIACPNWGCGAAFEERDRWEWHVRTCIGDDYSEDEENGEGLGQRCAARFLSRRTPQRVRDVLHARLKRVMGMDARWRGLMRKLKREAGEEGSEKREIFRNAFLDQMEADGGLVLGDEGERERTDLWVKVCWALDNE